MKNLLLALAVCTVAGCGSREEGPENGKIDNGVYRNEYFQFTVKLPSEWTVVDEDDRKSMMEAGKQAADSLNTDYADIAKDERVKNLLMLFQFKPGNEKDFNSSFIIMAEELPEAAANFDERAYLTLTREQLAQTGQYDGMDNQLRTREIGGKKFYTLKAQTVRTGVNITQEFYTDIMNGYVLIIVTSYATNDQKKMVDKILEDISF